MTLRARPSTRPRPSTSQRARAALLCFVLGAAAVGLVACRKPPGSAQPAAGGASTAGRRQHPQLIRGDGPFAYKPAPHGARAVRGGVAILALLNDPDSLNPFTSQSREAHEVQDLIFPHIATEQPDYDKGPPSFAPSLAESWTFTEDGLGLRLRLRDCVWSDGTPITAADVRFSWEAARHPQVAWVSATIVGEIRDIEIHSPRELTVHYNKRYPYQLMDICDVRILPRHVFGKIPFEAWQTHGSWVEEARISGGPWRLEEVKQKQQVVLVRNESYWDEGKPYLDKVVFRIIPSMDSMVTALLAGDIDYMQAITPEKVDEVLAHPELEVYTFLSRAYGAIAWNNERWPFDDPRVRRAMTYAIDRQNIVDSLFYGFAEVPRSHIISSLWAHVGDLEPMDYDPERAEALLAEAGFAKNSEGILEKDGKPLRFTMVTNAENEVRRQIIEYVQANLAEIGVQVVPAVQDANQFFTQLKQHQFDAGVHSMGNATKVDFKPVWHSSGAVGRFNVSAYRNPRVDQLIDEARVMMDLDASRPLWREVQEHLWRDQPETMVYERREITALHSRFQNVKPTALRTLHNLHEWWVPEDRRRAE